MEPRNGTAGLMIKSLIGLFIVITGTVTGVFANSMVAQQVRTELKQDEHGERLSALETFNKGVRDDLQRIDRNVDRILERITR